jgi:hypothetical protein
MYERHNQPLIPRKVFVNRVAKHALLAFGLLTFSLAIGILGYRGFERLSWLDSLLNASMLLGGMGEINPLKTVGGKIFASFYSLFSGMVFLVVAGLLVAPVAHRILHRMHLEK